MIAPAIKATSPDPSRRALLWVQYTFPHPRKWSILATALPLWTERNGEPFCPKSVVPTTFLPQSVHHPVIASHEVAWQSPVGWLLYPSKIYVIATLRPGNTFVLPGRSVLDSQTVWLFSRQGGPFAQSSPFITEAYPRASRIFSSNRSAGSRAMPSSSLSTISR